MVDDLATLARGEELPAKQAGLLERVHAADDMGVGVAQVDPGEVGALDLAILTRFHEAHLEYALVRLNDGPRTALVEMGSYRGGSLPPSTDQLLLHSHPPDRGSGMSHFVSREDVEAITMLGQTESYIVLTDGTVYRFTPDTPPGTIGELVREVHAYYGWVDASGQPAGPISAPGLDVEL